MNDKRDYKLNRKIEHITAIILVGGKSRRMNYQDKMNMKIDEDSFLERILKELPSFSSVIVSANVNQVEQLRQQQLEQITGTSPMIVVDQYEDIGPLGGICSVMNEINSEYYFVVSCDMPFITREVIRKIVNEIINGEHVSIQGDYQAVVAKTNGRVQPLFAIYNRNIQTLMLEQIESENYRMMSLLDKVKVQYVEVNDEELMQNINTLDELEKSRNKLSRIKS